MRKNRIVSTLLLLALLCSLFVPVSANGIDLQLQCTNAVLIDGTYGDVLYSHNAYDQAFPASMTKVMTALLTLEAIADGTVTEDTLVTVSAYAAQKDFEDESTANLQPGEEISVRDLLYCLMLPSANDAAKALAEHLGGTCEAFAETMNDRAIQLGCKDTHFVNPNGLHNPEHFTTAYDIALMYKACMEYDLFNTIVSSLDCTIAPTNLSGERYFYNTNGLVSPYYYGDHLYEKCIGGKTGSTSEAGKCLVAAARDGDMVMISVVMGAGPITDANGYTRLGQFDESKRLLEYGLTNFRRFTLTQPEEAVATVTVTMSEEGDSVELIPQGSLALTLPNSFYPEQVQTRVTLFADTVEAPVAEGQVMGSLLLFTEDRELGELELVARQSLEYSKKLERQQKRQAFWAKYKDWFIGIPLVIILLPVTALVALRIINTQRRKRRKKLAAQRRAAQRKRQTR